MSPRGERGIRFVCLLQETARQLMVFTTLRMVDRRKRDTELAALRVHPRLYVVRFVVRVGVSHPPALPIRRTAALVKPSLAISGRRGKGHQSKTNTALSRHVCLHKSRALGRPVVVHAGKSSL